MAEFNASLLREKFTIHDPESEMHEEGKSVVALSNRMVVTLQSANRKYEENFIVRAHNMHGCVRMCARIIHTFHEGGPIMSRPVPFDWEAAWDSLVNEYEHAYNPQRWVAIYHKGRMVYATGKHHALLDVIEQCDSRNEDQYEMSVALAEDAFKQAGKPVTIHYDSNVALVVTFTNNEGRCGIILRGPDRTTTFTFTAAGTKHKTLSIPQCMAAAAAYLEAIQLAFMIGMNNEKIRLNIIKRFSAEEKQTREAKKRLHRLSAEITNLESVYDVHYRPERPEFAVLIIDAEKLGQKILTPPDDDEDEGENEGDGSGKKDKKKKGKPSVYYHGPS